MKDLYLVRHAESESNRANIHDDGSAALTEVGREQAQTLAGRIGELEPSIVLSSTMPRAIETASVVTQELGVPQETMDDLRELLRPSEIIGQETAGETSKLICQKIRDNAGDPHWRYSDEENFVELRERVLKVLLDMADRNEERICAVTHLRVMRMCAAVVLHGKYVEPDAFFDFEDHLMVSNASISHIRLHDERTYELIGWNDTGHLT